MEATATSFDYVDLNQIDPSVKPVDQGVYTLKILKAEKKTSKAGDKEFIKFDLAITNDQNFSGRRLWPTLFPSDFTFKTLRKLMDVTGVAQDPGTDLGDWLKTLSEVQPEFKTLIRTYEDRKFVKGDKGIPTGEVRNFKPDSTPEVVNAINWMEIHPA